MESYKGYLAFCREYGITPFSFSKFVWCERIRPVIDYTIDAINLPIDMWRGRKTLNASLAMAGMAPLSILQYARLTCAQFGSQKR